MYSYKTKRIASIKNIPYLLFFVSFIILIIKSRYSFCWSDESFYSAVTSRFYKGDSIFYDEWFPTQLSSLLLLPIYSIFVSIVGSTEGIILFFRVLFVILELISAVLTYNIISKYHGIFAGASIGLLIQWYTHLNIATLSYYTMTLHFFVMSMLLMYNQYMKKADCESAEEKGDSTINKRSIQFIIAGFLFALSVLCLPTMCIAYFLVVITGFMLIIISKFVKNWSFLSRLNSALDFIYTFKYTLVGIVFPAAIFTIYMLTHISIPNFISSLTYVLSDDEHELSALYPLKKMYLSIDESYGSVAKLCYLFIAFCLFLSIFISAVKYFNNTRVSEYISKLLPVIRPVIFFVDIILFALYYYYSYTHTGYIFTAIMLFSLPLFLFTEKKNYTLFILTYISGLIFSLVYSYSSNGMLYLLSMGHFISSIGGIIFIKDFTNELIESNNKASNVISWCTAFIIFLSVSTTCTLRVTNIYRDDCLNKLTEKTMVGPAKGLYTSEEHLELYNSVYETITTYCMSDSRNGNNNLLISKLLPYGYLISDLNVAAPTVWRNPMDSLRLKEYYSLHEDRYPDVILVLDEKYGSYKTCGDVEADPIPNENASDGYMYEYIKENKFEEISVSCGKIYMRQ